MGCPGEKNRLSTMLAGSKGMGNRHSQMAAGICRKADVIPLSIHLRGSTPDFLSGLTSLALVPSPQDMHKAVRLLTYSKGFGLWAAGRVRTPSGHACLTSRGQTSSEILAVQPGASQLQCTSATTGRYCIGLVVERLYTGKRDLLIALLLQLHC